MQGCVKYGNITRRWQYKVTQTCPVRSLRLVLKWLPRMDRNQKPQAQKQLVLSHHCRNLRPYSLNQEWGKWCFIKTVDTVLKALAFIINRFYVLICSIFESICIHAFFCWQIYRQLANSSSLPWQQTYGWFQRNTRCAAYVTLNLLPQTNIVSLNALHPNSDYMDICFSGEGQSWYLQHQ